MSEIKFVNLTDIDIPLRTVDGRVLRLAAPGVKVKLPKVSNQRIKLDHVGGVMFEVRYKQPEIRFLPAPEAGTIYLVSGMISEVAERDDVLTPSEIDAIKQGREIVAYNRLVRYTRKPPE